MRLFLEVDTCAWHEVLDQCQMSGAVPQTGPVLASTGPMMAWYQMFAGFILTVTQSSEFEDHYCNQYLISL